MFYFDSFELSLYYPRQLETSGFFISFLSLCTYNSVR